MFIQLALKTRIQSLKLSKLKMNLYLSQWRYIEFTSYLCQTFLVCFWPINLRFCGRKMSQFVAPVVMFGLYYSSMLSGSTGWPPDIALVLDIFQTLDPTRISGWSSIAWPQEFSDVKSLDCFECRAESAHAPSDLNKMMDAVYISCQGFGNEALQKSTESLCKRVVMCC